MMIFIAHVTDWDEDKEAKYIITFSAENFTKATEMIESYFGLTLQSIDLLEPISDGNFVYLTTEAEEMIRNHPYNDF